MADPNAQLPTPDETPKVEEPAPAPAPASRSASVPGEETPAEASDDDDSKHVNSNKVTLADLTAKGTTLYAQKKFEEAAELFSRASILQADINGETAPENAEILFHYGRCLFKVGQSKSDVLGGPTAAESRTKANGQGSSSKAKGSAAKPATTEAQKVTQEGLAVVAEQKEEELQADAKGEDKAADAGPSHVKPLFQFTGDENFDDSDEDEEEGEGDEEAEEEEDDLAVAFEILDLARVCYLKLLDRAESEAATEKGKEVASSDSSSVRHIKERLADTHDALAEISLENERYPSAIEDGRVSLRYKMQLYPEESEIIAEAHYKLSLALEFASVTTSAEDGAPAKREAMDQGLRDEAVQEMELAIKSFKLKLRSKEVELATMASPEDNDQSRKAILDMKEVIADMETRLVELRADPVDTKGLLGADAAANPLGGVLSTVMGKSATEMNAELDEAVRTAKDLSGMVRKVQRQKPKDDVATSAGTSEGNSAKRKAEDEEGEEPSKKKKSEPAIPVESAGDV